MAALSMVDVWGGEIDVADVAVVVGRHSFGPVKGCGLLTFKKSVYPTRSAD